MALDRYREILTEVTQRDEDSKKSKNIEGIPFTKTEVLPDLRINGNTAVSKIF